MTEPTYTRYCIAHGKMELVRRLQNGNEIVRCPHCERIEEITSSGMALPGQPTPKEVRP